MENEKVKVSRIMIFAINACLLYLIAKTLISSLIMGTGLSKPWCDCIAEGITLILTAVMAIIQRKDAPSYGICPGTYKGSLKYIIPLALLASMIIPYFIMVPVTDPFLPALLDVIFIGIMEELIFRGLVFRAAEVFTGEGKAVIISSILFGLLHLINLSGDDPVPYVLLQVVFNAVIGLAFAALRVKTKSILAGIVIHTFLDMNAIFVDTISWVEIAQIIMYFAVGIVLYVFYRKDAARKTAAPAG